MNQYVTGAIIKKLREARQMTQHELAEKLCVSDKTISKWETGKGYPDITLIEPVADALGISVIELMAGEAITNSNRSFNMRKSAFYVCPVCGNVVVSTGEAVVSCCGITLLAQLPEHSDEEHPISIERIEDEYFISIDHEMSKRHYISFIAAIRNDSVEIIKLYPEGNAETRVKKRNLRRLYFYCNRHGLFSAAVK